VSIQGVGGLNCRRSGFDFWDPGAVRFKGRVGLGQSRGP
jgi:hypothetical protein